VYKTQSEYTQDYEVSLQAAKAVHGNNKQTQSTDPSVGWKLYCNARKPKLGFHLFGRHVASKKLSPYKANPSTHTGRVVKDLPPNLQGISRNNYDKFDENFGLVNEAESGSILIMGGDKWNFTLNDTWIVGGVHSGLPFYACSPLVIYNVFDYEYILTITGRELLGLALFGYMQQTHAELGTVFVCNDKKKAKGARLSEYQAVIGELKRMADASKVFSDAGFTVRNAV